LNLHQEKTQASPQRGGHAAERTTTHSPTAGVSCAASPLRVVLAAKKKSGFKAVLRNGPLLGHETKHSFFHLAAESLAQGLRVAVCSGFFDTVLVIPQF
jgi:hypothetical protein